MHIAIKGCLRFSISKSRLVKARLCYFLSIFSICISALPSALLAKPIIAVAPFENINQSKEVEWLTIGISEAVLANLKPIQSIRIVDRIQLKRVTDEQKLQLTDLFDPKHATSLGHFLGATHLVVGSYQIYGGKIRIVARIVSVESGEVIKTSNLIGIMDNIFDLQDQIAQALEETLNYQVTPDERETLKLHLTESASAYEAYIRGLQKWEAHKTTWKMDIPEYLEWRNRYNKSAQPSRDYLVIDPSALNIRSELGLGDFERALSLDPTFPEPLFYLLSADKPYWYFRQGRGVYLEDKTILLRAAIIHLNLYESWRNNPNVRSTYRLARYYALIADKVRLGKAKQLVDNLLVGAGARSSYNTDLLNLRSIISLKMKSRKYTTDPSFDDLEKLSITGDQDTFDDCVLIAEGRDRLTLLLRRHYASLIDELSAGKGGMSNAERAKLEYTKQIGTFAVSLTPKDPLFLYGLDVIRLRGLQIWFHTNGRFESGDKLTEYIDTRKIGTSLRAIRDDLFELRTGLYVENAEIMDDQLNAEIRGALRRKIDSQLATVKMIIDGLDSKYTVRLSKHHYIMEKDGSLVQSFPKKGKARVRSFPVDCTFDFLGSKVNKAVDSVVIEFPIGRYTFVARRNGRSLSTLVSIDEGESTGVFVDFEGNRIDVNRIKKVVKVVDVQKDTQAATIDIRKGDIIVSYGGRTICSSQELRTEVENLKNCGVTEIEVILRRGDELVRVVVKPGKIGILLRMEDP